MRALFEQFRAAFWALTAGVLGLYVFGLFVGVYSPLELGILSTICLTLLVLFTVHEVLLRRDRKAHPPQELDHSDRERRGW